ncbi:hypothetical protein DYB32_005071 [Aphanomyces invadans]|uniref:Cytochrome P450 n=1 Tax=Aphanomyces invadans TaxID=157072 RepID=A0A418AVQ6_9STRA|nr:hypothetical protein DYB32_005071 [Aphanomyces invadans]
MWRAVGASYGVVASLGGKAIKFIEMHRPNMDAAVAFETRVAASVPAAAGTCWYDKATKGLWIQAADREWIVVLRVQVANRAVRTASEFADGQRVRPLQPFRFDQNDVVDAASRSVPSMSLAALDVSAVLLCAAVVVVGAATCLAGMFLFVVFPVGGTPLKRVPGPPSTSFLLGNMYVRRVVLPQAISCVCTGVKSLIESATSPTRSSLTLNNVGLTAFGYDFQSNPDAIVAFDELQAMPNKLLLACSMCIPGFSWLPFPSFRRRHHARAKLLCIMQDIIDRKLATGPTTSTSTTPRDLLDRMLEAGTSTHDAVVHTLTVMFAGHDTTTAALCWTFYRLACEPSKAALARRECLHLLDVHGSFDQWQALHDLTYTTAFIQETLRLHPPVPFIGRRMARDDVHVPKSDGSSVFVSKGTSVCVVHAAMQRDPTYWAHPNDFVPERFVPGTCAYAADLGLRHGRGHAVHYMPFSAGSKNCIGQRFAMAELQVVVATLLTKYEFTLAPDADHTNLFNGISVQPTRLTMAMMPLRASPPSGL